MKEKKKDWCLTNVNIENIFSFHKFHIPNPIFVFERGLYLLDVSLIPSFNEIIAIFCMITQAQTIATV